MAYTGLDHYILVAVILVKSLLLVLLFTHMHCICTMLQVDAVVLAFP